MKSIDRFIVLDGLRGVAALAVVRVHWLGGPQAVPSAHLAVDLFFVLSGFVLAHATHGKLSSWRDSLSFARARIIRLLPLSFLGLSVGFAWLLWRGYRGWFEFKWSILLAYVCNALMMPAPAFSVPSIHGLYPFAFDVPEWSLFFELVANIAFAFLAIRHSLIAIGIATAVGAVLLVEAALTFGTLDIGLRFADFRGGFGRVGFSFFAGVALYLAREHFAWMRVARAPFWVLSAALVVLLTFGVQGRTRLLFDLGSSLVFFPLIVLLGANASAGRLDSLCRTSGAMSYPLYIIHSPIVLATSAYLPGLANSAGVSVSNNSSFVVLAAFLVLLALALDRFFDQPVRAYLRRGSFLGWMDAGRKGPQEPHARAKEAPRGVQ